MPMPSASSKTMDFAACPGEPPRHREADHASPDNHAIDLVHQRFKPEGLPRNWVVRIDFLSLRQTRPAAKPSVCLAVDRHEAILVKH